SWLGHGDNSDVAPIGESGFFYRPGAGGEHRVIPMLAQNRTRTCGETVIEFSRSGVVMRRDAEKLSYSLPNLRALGPSLSKFTAVREAEPRLSGHPIWGVGTWSALPHPAPAAC